MIDAPPLAEVLTPDQHRLLVTDPEFEPVVALVDTVKATGVSTTGALLEAARGSPHADLYAEVASDGLAGSSSFDNARADLEGVLEKLELHAVKVQYEQLLAQPGMSETERARLQRLQQRLSELKGGPPVGVVPPASPL
jgi:hypothetical protein